MAEWVPDRGDVVWIDFNPQAGSEQAGRRPAVVLSPAAYNGKVGLAIFCPITRQVKDYPFEVQLPEGVGIAGVILSDRIKSLDWRSPQRSAGGFTAETDYRTSLAEPWPTADVADLLRPRRRFHQLRVPGQVFSHVQHLDGVGGAGYAGEAAVDDGHYVGLGDQPGGQGPAD